MSPPIIAPGILSARWLERPEGEGEEQRVLEVRTSAGLRLGVTRYALGAVYVRDVLSLPQLIVSDDRSAVVVGGVLWTLTDLHRLAKEVVRVIPTERVWEYTPDDKPKETIMTDIIRATTPQQKRFYDEGAAETKRFMYDAGLTPEHDARLAKAFAKRDELVGAQPALVERELSCKACRRVFCTVLCAADAVVVVKCEGCEREGRGTDAK